LINIYKTRDAKFLSIVGIQSDRHWPVLCDRAGQPVLRDDPRFVDSAARAANRVACTNELDVLFASKTLAEWREAFADSDLVWEPVQNVDEVSRDPQLHANEYLVEVEEPGPDGPQWLVSPPVQFEEHSNRPSRAPEHGEQTEQILLEMGFEWDEIATLKDQGAIC
jgi:crotonobetainyl-CoA:carnitine CoA-transferase CaiB-like acyl-CoA transferase